MARSRHQIFSGEPHECYRVTCRGVRSENVQSPRRARMEHIEPDEGAEADPPSDTEPSEDSGSGFERWRRDSALGVVGTGVARGLQAVFAPPVDEQVIVASVPGDPPGEDERIQVILDPDDPTKSVAIVPERKDTPPASPS
jgi:hypothetical protein